MSASFSRRPISAGQFKLVDRGELRPGAYADTTVFDPLSVQDVATFEQPSVPARGIRSVLVNGVIAYREGRAESVRAGRFLGSRT